MAESSCEKSCCGDSFIPAAVVVFNAKIDVKIRQAAVRNSRGFMVKSPFEHLVATLGVEASWSLEDLLKVLD